MKYEVFLDYKHRIKSIRHYYYTPHIFYKDTLVSELRSRMDGKHSIIIDTINYDEQRIN